MTDIDLWPSDVSESGSNLELVHCLCLNITSDILTHHLTHSLCFCPKPGAGLPPVLALRVWLLGGAGALDGGGPPVALLCRPAHDDGDDKAG